MYSPWFLRARLGHHEEMALKNESLAKHHEETAAKWEREAADNLVETYYSLGNYFLENKQYGRARVFLAEALALNDSARAAMRKLVPQAFQ